jgi:hypothetical protein
MKKGWLRLLMLLTTIVLVNLSTYFVLDNNLKNGVYPPDGDTIIIGILDTFSLSLLTLPFLIIVGILPCSGFAHRLCQRSIGWCWCFGALISIGYLAALGLLVIGLLMWAIPNHYIIAVFYIFALLVLGACFSVDLRGFFSNPSFKRDWLKPAP